jgi:predicted MFS family arabinose efflux permease
LALGIAGTAIGVGASLSTTVAGYVSDRFGSPVAFLVLSVVAALGLACIWLMMPETRPQDEPAPPGPKGMAAIAS